MLTKLRSRLAARVLLLCLILLSGHVAEAQIIDESQANIPPLALTACNNSALHLYDVCEIVIPQNAYGNELDAYTKPDIKAVFVNENDRTITKTVHGFFDRKDGNIVFKVRFNASIASAAGATDTWSYSLSCTLQSDPGTKCPAGINLTGGTFTVGPSTEKGFLRGDASKNYRFVYDNGYHPFIWGQTYYNILDNVLDPYGGSWVNSIDQSVLYKLNKVRLLVNPFIITQKYKVTKPFNDPTVHDQINLNHWKALDAVVDKLHKTRDAYGNRMLAEIILYTDLNPEAFAPDATRDDRYIRYAVARYAAFPNVMWCLANEWQLNKPPVTNDVGAKKAYFQARGNTLRDSDPWRLSPTGQKRALSIHPNNSDPIFQFYDQNWASHAVLQYSIGHGLCDLADCLNSDEWANFSIIENLNHVETRPSGNILVNPDLVPIVNDEYGYLNSRLKADKDDTNPCPNGFFTSEMQRRGAWAVAIAGGYGTFGDSTKTCDSVGNTGWTPTITADWIYSSTYVELNSMIQFFNNTIGSGWWQMMPNNARVSRYNNTMRVYALEQVGTSLNDVVVYAVPTGRTGSAKNGSFYVTVPKGKWQPTFYDPRAKTLVPISRDRRRTTALSTSLKFDTPSYDDWVFRLLRVKSLDTTDNDIVWVGDSIPAGAGTAGANEPWNWVDSDPQPFGDALAHKSALMSGMHLHYFYNATETLAVNSGDTLFAYVYLDPVNPPSEVMLQWNDGNWEHRAYWGADEILWGTSGTAARRYMGALPAPGQWARLEVPASAVGLEGRVLNGMAFILNNGQATWDDAGKLPSATAPAPTPSLSINDVSVVEGNAGSVNAVFTVRLSASSTNTVQVNFSTANGTAIANTDYTPVTGTITFNPGETVKSVLVPIIGDATVESDEAFFVNLSSPSNATLSDAQGQAVILNDDSPSATVSGEVLWVEDALPPGTTPGGTNESWSWVATSPPPFSGAYAHQSSLLAGVHQHFFTGASGTSALTPGTGDKLFAYVYLDPMNTPSEIMLQWADSLGWEHRAYWGANLISFGTDGTASRRYAGPLPPAGRWVRLEVPASAVGVEGVTLQGMAFTLYNGRATWDYAGKVSNSTIWVEDGLPYGAIQVNDTDAWNWVGGLNPSPFSGNVAHQSALLAGFHQHYFYGAAETLSVNAGDKLFTYVYLDPANPPSEVMLQWDDGSGGWNHRAYWGANLIGLGTDGTASRRYMGALPPPARWVRLEVPASMVGLEGQVVNSMAFTLYNGRATWDYAGK
jgi:hypothetical protein